MSAEAEVKLLDVLNRLLTLPPAQREQHLRDMSLPDESSRHANRGEFRDTRTPMSGGGSDVGEKAAGGAGEACCAGYGATGRAEGCRRLGCGTRVARGARDDPLSQRRRTSVMCGGDP